MTTVAKFAPTPYEVTKCGDPFALAVWTVIRQYHQINVTGGKWIHNLVFYAKELQLSVETVRRKIHFLIKKGFLIRERRNSYQFGYNYEIPEEWLCLTEEQLKEYRKHKKVKVKMSKESGKKSEAEKPKNFDQNLELGASETHDFDEGYINKDLIKKEFIKEEGEILEEEHTYDIDEFQEEEDNKSEIVIEKPILKRELTLNNKNLSEDTSSERVARDIRLGLPAGEWLDEETGDFKQGFLQWRADWALKTFKDIETELNARQWARKNFFNHPEELPLHWFNYKETFETKMENVKVRIDNGVQIRQEEKETFGRMGVELGAFTPRQELISPGIELEPAVIEPEKTQLIVEEELRPEVKARLEEIRAKKNALSSACEAVEQAQPEEKVVEVIEEKTVVENESVIDIQGLNPVEYLRKIMTDYKSTPVWEREDTFYWNEINWGYALGNNYTRWMQLVRGSAEGEFAGDDSLGMDYGVRTLFHRWHQRQNELSSVNENVPDVNENALNAIGQFLDLFKAKRGVANE